LASAAEEVQGFHLLHNGGLFATHAVAADYGCLLGLKIDSIGFSKIRSA
jgi:hypothetical protein